MYSRYCGTAKRLLREFSPLVDIAAAAHRPFEDTCEHNAVT